MTPGQPVVLDVAKLEALLRKTFNIGLDVGRGREKVDLVRLRLSKALLGAAEAQALAADRSRSSAAWPLRRSPRQTAWRCTQARSTASPIRSSI